MKRKQQYKSDTCRCNDCIHQEEPDYTNVIYIVTPPLCCTNKDSEYYGQHNQKGCDLFDGKIYPKAGR